MVKIEWTDPALEDLNQIFKYIARDSTYYANLFIKRIYESIQNLKDFPESGRVVPEKGINNLREIIMQNYRIIYRYRKVEKIVEILTIIHGSRQLVI